MSDTAFMTVQELSDALDARQLSVSELFAQTVSGLERLEPQLNMFAHLDLDGAKSAAEAAEDRQMRGERRSLLDGIPTSVKDLIAVRGMPLRFGSRAVPDTPAPEDAPSVERLRAAGAVILGKSTTSEFGSKGVGDSPLTGITRNPWNPDLTPGGSSCGAAAMVAAGLVPYAVATDGGGSIRIPASLTGLYGIKGQFGRVPVYPVPATPTLGHVGPLARNVADAALALETMSGYDRRDPFSVAEPAPRFRSALDNKAKLRIAYSPTLGFAHPLPEVTAATANGAEALAEMGHEVDVVERVMDDPFAMWVAEFYAGVGTRLRTVIENTPDLLDPAVLDVLREAIGQDMGEYYKSVFARYAFRDEMRRFFELYDALITPTLPVAAFPTGLDVPPELQDRSLVSWVFYTYGFNLSGQPAASVNVGFTADQRPIGLQIVGRLNDEMTVLALSAALHDHYADALSSARPPVRA